MIWSRFAAAVARLIQSLEAREGRLQLYLDDPFFALRGSAGHRSMLISMVFGFFAALGVQISWRKCARGARITWIGVQFEVKLKEVQLTIPEKKIQELKKEALELAKPGLIPLKRLRAFVGLMSWVAGCLPRIRWVVRILYGVLRDAELEDASGAEARRPDSRPDRRVKRGMVAAKRAGIALPFALAFWEQAPSTLVRVIAACPPRIQLTVVTDASPWGLGGLLVHAASGQVVSYFDSPVTAFDEETLGITIGESAAQGLLEMLAVLVAFAAWQPFFAARAARVTSGATPRSPSRPLRS